MTSTAHPDSPGKRRILVVASLVSSLVMLDSNIVAVALPTIAQSLSGSFEQMQWVITAYVLPFAALLLAAGSFADIVGRRRAALLGQFVFAVASLFCGIATTPAMLNGARALQGVGAALLLTSALAIINHSFQGAERARAYAFWGACLGIAITCGPILGGVIASVFGWHWAFLINLPICALLIAATLRWTPESSDPEAKSLDYGGVITFSAGLFLLIWAVIEGNALGWGSTTIVGRLAGALALLAAFVVVERVQRRPMVDFSIFRSAYFLGTVAAMVGYAAGAQVMIFYLPLYLQNAYGFAPVVAGLAMLPFALPMFIVPRFGARLAMGSRGVLTLGLSVSALANVAMAMLASNAAPYAVFAVAMTAAGCVAGLLNGETAKAMQGAVPPERSGMASGLSATVRFSALLLGVAGLGAMLGSAATRRFRALSSGWDIGPELAGSIAKRFAAGDVDVAARLLPNAFGDAALRALRQSFEAGFGAVATAAASVAVVTMLATVFLMRPDRRTVKVAAGLVAPGE